MQTDIADIFKIFEGRKKILVHQANCQNLMGSGIARVIRDKFPQAWQADCVAAKAGTNKVGYYSVAPIISDDKYKHPNYIVNLYGQDQCTRNSLGDRDTSYDAVYEGLKRLFDSTSVAPYRDYHFLFPYGMSSSLAGARWPIIQKMIEVLGEGRKISICRLPNTEDLT